MIEELLKANKLI